MNSNYFFDDKTLETASSLVRKKMTSVLSKNLKTNLENQSGNLEKLADWYKKARMGRDKLLSQIANDIVKNLLEKLPQRYVKLAVENIDITTEDKKPNVKFDAEYEIDPIKPYVEFTIRVGGKKLHSERATFEVNSKGKFKEMEIKIEQNKKKLCLGKLEAKMQILLVRLPFVPLAEPEELVSKEIRTDLSKCCIWKLNRSAKLTL